MDGDAGIGWRMCSSLLHLLQEAMEQAVELVVSANGLRKDRVKLQTLELQCHSYPVVPNSGRTSCSKDATILLCFFRGLGPGRRSARSHSVSPCCHKCSCGLRKWVSM